MANGHGGYRAPANPAPASGPGAMSRRTDGGPSQPARYVSGGDYGDGQELMSVQQAAPMSASGSAQTQAQRPATPQVPLPTPIGAPTERPDEPVTEGNPLGPGSGPGVLTFPSYEASHSKDMDALKRYLPDLEVALGFDNVPETFRSLVNYIRNS